MYLWIIRSNLFPTLTKYILSNKKGLWRKIMLKKSLLGLGLVLMLAFSFVIPTFASTVSEGQIVKAEGTIQSVDPATGSFDVLQADGTVVTVYAPEGFDLTLLVVGDQVEAKGVVGADGLFAASEIELQDGTEFDVEDVEDVDEIEDAEDTEIQDEDQDENEIEDSEESEDGEHDEDAGESQSDSGSDSGVESGED
jgi:hypothetical protein